jgi:hypothetical protein
MFPQDHKASFNEECLRFTAQTRKGRSDAGLGDSFSHAASATGVAIMVSNSSVHTVQVKTGLPHRTHSKQEFLTINGIRLRSMHTLISSNPFGVSVGPDSPWV